MGGLVRVLGTLATTVTGLAFALGGSTPAEAATASPPPPPLRPFAVRVGPGVIGVEWDARETASLAGFRVFRSENRDGPYRPIADRGGDRPFFLDAEVEPSTVYFYTVASFSEDGTESARAGPACAWDDDQLLAGGSFEFAPVGAMEGQPSGWPRRAYNPKTPVVIVAGGPDGNRSVEIRASDTSPSGGFHSGMIPAVEGEVFDQFCWTKSLPGTRPMVGRCFYTEDRETVKVGKKPYDYTSPGKPRGDGWTPHQGSFTVPETGAYCVVWLIGFKARNTFWLDGARLVDRTSQRVRAFDDDQVRGEVAEMLRTSAAARSRRREFDALEAEIATSRRRMRDELATLTPLAYRRLLVAVDRAQRRLVDLLWEVKIFALLED